MNYKPQSEMPDFEQLYLFYYPKLVRFSREYVFTQEDAENLVQDVFMTIWEQRKDLPYIQHISSYLFRLTKNKCIDFLRRKIMSAEKMRLLQDWELKEYEYRLHSMEQFHEDVLNEQELDRLIYQVIESLPEKCREVFLLSRFEELSHQQIADRLNISTSTVNNHITTAMKKLKEKLKDSPLLFFLLF